MTGQRLPRAYRSRPRPSSALGAKASIVCPCSLDQKNTGNRCRYGVFKVHASELALLRATVHGCRPAQSLKTQQRTKTYVEVDVVLGEPNAGRLFRRTSINGVGAYRP
jgi:hypothetical protein